MAAGKDDPLSLKQAAKLLGMSDRGTAKLLRQGKLVEYEGPTTPRERGRPPILVTRSSVAEYARAAGRILRELSPEEARGRHAGLTRWLNEQERIVGKLKRARIVLIDGEGSGGQVWVRFLSTRSRGREILGSFWRQDVRGLFGSRKFRVSFDGQRADVYVRSADEELDQDELARCVNAAANCVNKEKARLSEERSRESRG
jgi:hypothetical protein